MIKNEDVIRSLNKFLYDLIEVPALGYVYGRNQTETAVPKLDAGNVVVFFSKGNDTNTNFNHPKFRLNLLITAKNSDDAVLKINHIKDIIEEAVMPNLTIDLYCYDTGTGVKNGKLVVLNSHTIQYYWDKDKYLYLPVNFEISYANKFW